MIAELAAAAMVAVAPMAAHEAKPLEPAASYVAHKPVTVMCQPLGENGGLTVPGSSLITIDSQYCTTLTRWRRGVSVKMSALAVAVHSLVHEGVHARGVTDEGVTDCAAYRLDRRVASRFFGVRSYYRLYVLMGWIDATRAGYDADYRTVC